MGCLSTVELPSFYHCLVFHCVSIVIQLPLYLLAFHSSHLYSESGATMRWVFVCLSFCIFASQSLKYWFSGIIGKCIYNIATFLSNSFHRGCTILHSPQQYKQFLFPWFCQQNCQSLEFFWSILHLGSLVFIFSVLSFVFRHLKMWLLSPHIANT